jgi:pimeloyl-ACP methyl ester carboxylesterase
MRHKTIKIDGINIFYREAGDPKSPKLALLHGFPSSSHQYRNLMPALVPQPIGAMNAGRNGANWPGNPHQKSSTVRFASPRADVGDMTHT